MGSPVRRGAEILLAVLGGSGAAHYQQTPKVHVGGVAPQYGDDIDMIYIYIYSICSTVLRGKGEASDFMIVVFGSANVLGTLLQSVPWKISPDSGREPV